MIHITFILRNEQVRSPLVVNIPRQVNITTSFLDYFFCMYISCSKKNILQLQFQLLFGSLAKAFQKAHNLDQSNTLSFRILHLVSTPNTIGKTNIQLRNFLMLWNFSFKHYIVGNSIHTHSSKTKPLFTFKAIIERSQHS